MLLARRPLAFPYPAREAPGTRPIIWSGGTRTSSPRRGVAMRRLVSHARNPQNRHAPTLPTVWRRLSTWRRVVWRIPRQEADLRRTAPEAEFPYIRARYRPPAGTQWADRFLDCRMGKSPRSRTNIAASAWREIARIGPPTIPTVAESGDSRNQHSLRLLVEIGAPEIRSNTLARGMG